MKSALELRKSKQEKLEQKQKENTERINLEMLEIEKAFNKWESDLDDKNPYITVPLIIRTEEVKSLLAENGYIIDKTSNDIEVNTTRIWLDVKEYDAVLNLDYINKQSDINKKIFEQKTQKQDIEALLKKVVWL